MTKPAHLVAFDVETTGKNPLMDQIIELSICRVAASDLSSPLAPVYVQRFKPDVPVSPGAQAVHGLSDDDLRDQPPFSRCADEIESLLLSADVLVGYNVGFDIRFVEAEFQRLGRTLNLYSKPVVDPLRMWQSLEPRRLENAVERFVGTSLDDAHSAEADTRAVLDVLDGMRAAFGLEDASWEELAAFTSPERASWVGPSHHLRWESDQVVIGFGKYSGQSVLDLSQTDPDYLRWMEGKGDFPAHVKNLCKGALSGLTRREYHDRVARHFPRPEPDVSGD